MFSVLLNSWNELRFKTFLPCYLIPDLLTPCYGPDGVPFTEIYAKHAKAEILNPILNQTYDFFKTFFNEIRDVFSDEYIHLGMDEVYYDCWQSNPDIAKFMQEKGFVNISQVEQYYVHRTLENVRDLGYKYMTWQDPVDNGVKVRLTCQDGAAEQRALFTESLLLLVLRRAGASFMRPSQFAIVVLD